MIVGAGLEDGSAAAVHFRSTDLVSWTCDGLLASRVEDTAGLRTGQVWECPQLFPLGDDWVLLVSVWADDELYYVAAAIGEYDGRRFEARSWQQLTHGSSAYAMTAFEDRDGRRCVQSWLREEPRNHPDRVGWVGAHSVASVVTLDSADRLVLIPHPDLDDLGAHAPRPAVIDVDGRLRVPMESGAAEVTLLPTCGSDLLVTADTGEIARIEFDEEGLSISRPALPADHMPVHSGQRLVILIDADIVEVFGPAGYGAFRIGAATDPASTELAVSSPHPELSVRTF
jgi:beta-fructofuranosidase